MVTITSNTNQGYEFSYSGIIAVSDDAYGVPVNERNFVHDDFCTKLLYRKNGFSVYRLINATITRVHEE